VASSRAGLRPASEWLASYIAPDRPNSINYTIQLASTSLAGRRSAREPAREPASELDSVMEFGLYLLCPSIRLRLQLCTGQRSIERPSAPSRLMISSKSSATAEVAETFL